MDEKLKLELLGLASLTKGIIRLEFYEGDFILGTVEKIIPGFIMLKIDHAGRSCIVPISISTVKDIF